MTDLEPGATLRVRHLRRFVVTVPKHDGSPAGARRAAKVAGADLNPKGGRTVATITLPDGGVLTGVARCRGDESFNRELGRRIAMGRVLAKYAHLLAARRRVDASNWTKSS